jgi:type III restriction enzyme
MKLQFDSNLNYQRDAINAVINLFEGLPFKQSVFVTSLKQDNTLFNNLGIGNPPRLEDEKLLHNLHIIQEQNSIPKSRFLIEQGDTYSFPNFSVEMETGTGKTYVYLRTIFELNQKYDFKKFIIVVPSVAIREGVLSSIKLMKTHLAQLYNNVPFNFFVYNSSDLSNVRQFALSYEIQIVIINIQAFQKDAGDIEDYSNLTDEQRKNLNIIHTEQDKMSGRKPIEYIQATRPIVIIDEPQSVDTTDKSKRAIKNLKPLFCLRYSATHINPYNLLYKLEPIRAYDLKLVKQIEVASIHAKKKFNEVFIRLDFIGYKKGAKIPHAKASIHENKNGYPKVKTVILKQGTDIDRHTNSPGYDGYIVTNICAESGLECVEFANGKRLALYQEEGGMKDEILQKQIYLTVEEHLRKERRFQERGIKVLSLFFIDVVANYRWYDDNGNPQKGKLAEWFESAFQELSQKPLYQGLIPYPVEQLHNGYFSVDKKRGKVVGLKDTSGTTKADEETYELIVKDKERLLSFEEPLRFIFTHSALKEGWDNPNVFQICTLREMGTERERRQILGRGLRLPVNQEGVRIYDESINRLTIIASESFEEYAKGLQAEIEKDLGNNFKFGRIHHIAFANLIDEKTDRRIGQEQSQKIWQALVDNGYLDENGDLTEKFVPEEKGFQLELPLEIVSMQVSIIDEMKRYIFTDRIANATDRRTLKYNKCIELNEYFQILWEKINRKTRYSVEFHTSQLVETAVEKIKAMKKIQATGLLIEKTEMEIHKIGVESGRILKTETNTVINDRSLPDILAFLQSETDLTRSTLVEILTKSKRLKEFAIAPQAFMTETAKLIKHSLQETIIDSIKYEQLQDQYYEMHLFAEKEIAEYLSKLYKVQSHDNRYPYDYITVDSELEREIAEKLDTNENVKFFCKLPRWFVIPTPFGNYNPDLAVVLEGEKKLYLVLETKGICDKLGTACASRRSNRRDTKSRMLECGKAHFEALGVSYKVVTNIQEVLAK